MNPHQIIGTWLMVGWTNQVSIDNSRLTAQSWILDSDACFPDSLSLELEFQIPIVGGIPDFLKYIPYSKGQESGFHKQKFQKFAIPESRFPHMGRESLNRSNSWPADPTKQKYSHNDIIEALPYTSIPNFLACSLKIDSPESIIRLFFTTKVSWLISVEGG